MEFFQCPCPERGNVILNGRDQGPNKDEHGNLLTKQCNRGRQYISLRCRGGIKCPMQLVLIEDTDPILPMEVPFQCE
jgi:hypothetical protein